ncbi:MAG: anti-sigma factor antagonist [Clostridiales bacterium]|nr:anti-sigma factor antagonist [Clostridiales bacterium]
MNIRLEFYKNILIISPIGELDHFNIEKFRNKEDIQIRRKKPSNIIFDLSRVTFIDSPGIGYILGKYKLCMLSGGKTAFVNVNGNTRKILEISGLLKIIKICPTVDQAILAIEKGGL